MKLQINVTKDVLEKSKNCQDSNDYDKAAGTNCAISLAVRDVFPNAFVSQYFFYPEAKSWDDIEMNGQGILLPLHVTKFIKTFDYSTPVERVEMLPISFQLEIPDEVINRINIDEVKELLVNHPTLQLV